MKAIKLPQSRAKRELTSIFRKIESGSLDMVEVTRNGRGIACIVRYDGDYQAPRESLSPDSEDHDSWFHKKVMEALADTRPTVPHKQVMGEVQHEIQLATERFDHLDQILTTENPEVVAKARAKADIILETLERMSEANWKVNLEKDENGDTVVILPTELLDELHWEIGDDIDVIAEPGKIRLINLSLQLKLKHTDT